MASNAELVRQKYADPSYEDGRAERSRAAGFEFHYTKKHLTPYIIPIDHVVEIGCATGHYGMHFASRCKSYTGVDLSPANIGEFRRKIAEAGLENVRAEVGDATDLSAFSDGQFDVVLCLGPMYHLPAEERELVFQECRRICRPGGIVAFAYINKGGAYMKGYLVWPEQYPNAFCNEMVLEKGTDDRHPGLFYFSTPEEMNFRARENGLEVLKNVGVDFTYDEETINTMNDEQLEAFMRFHDFLCDSPSCTGMSDHGLLICRKPD